MKRWEKGSNTPDQLNAGSLMAIGVIYPYSLP